MSGVSLHYGPGAWTDEHGVMRWKRRWRTDDGRDWHEPATGQEIADLPGDARAERLMAERSGVIKVSVP